MTRFSVQTDMSSFTTDAKFRTWGSNLNALFTGAGLVQTADTGQINWTTVTKPATNGTAAGYEVWRFNDSLQSTDPIFIRVVYNTGFQSASTAALQWQVGSGTDGAGNLTGFKTTVIANPSLTVSVTTSNPSHTAIATHTSGFFGFWGDSYTAGSTGGVTQEGLFFVDRHRSQTDGSPATGGWTAGATFYVAALTSVYLITWTVATANGYTDAAWLAEGIQPPSNAASGWGNRLFPFYVSTPTPCQGVGVIGVGRADIAQKATFTCYPIGTSIRRTYINVCSSDATYRMGGNVDASPNTGLAMLWED